MNEQDNNTNQNNVVDSLSNTGTVPVQQTNIDNTTQLNVTQNIPQTNLDATQNIPQDNNLDNASQISMTQNIDTSTVSKTEQSSQNTSTNTTTSGEDNSVKNEVVKEKKKSEYKPPSAFKTFLLIVFFGGLIAFIVFLPEIQAFVAEQMPGGKPINTEITSGKLVCTLDTNTSNLNISYERVFAFGDKKLETAKFTTITKGDVTQDEQTLNEMDSKCKAIKESVYSVPGVSITCDYSAGLLTQREHFDYKDYDIEKVKAAYTEAGGEVVEYELGYDIDKIQTAMLQGGFECKKER